MTGERYVVSSGDWRRVVSCVSRFKVHRLPGRQCDMEKKVLIHSLFRIIEVENGP